MDEIREFLLREVRRTPDLQNLATACGQAPSREPPSPATLQKLRTKLGRLLGLSKTKVAKRHPASPWFFNIVRSVQQRAKDPDTAVADWLEHGAPFGVALPVPPGGLLPLVSENASLTPEQLQHTDEFEKNHGSFDEKVGDTQPAMDELISLVDQGFARVFTDKQEAEDWLGAKAIVTPLGNVVKTLADSSRKNRLIQDFRASQVNFASIVRERQVLPRFADHGLDLATLSAFGSSVGVFVLDFKHAFMTIPLATEEMPYNTSVVPEGLCRSREALDESEPREGKFLVWRVLGFGGHANPLVYARVACVAARTAQALLYHPAETSSIAHGRLQLYVDDPVIALSGSDQEQQEAIDVVIAWWLLLGIPLSWRKGCSKCTEA